MAGNAERISVIKSTELFLATKEDSMRKCCYIGCKKNAEFEIYDENERRPDCGVTDACEDHIGALLGSLPPTEPKGPWCITVIK